MGAEKWTCFWCRKTDLFSGSESGPGVTEIVVGFGARPAANRSPRHFRSLRVVTVPFFVPLGISAS